MAVVHVADVRVRVNLRVVAVRVAVWFAIRHACGVGVSMMFVGAMAVFVLERVVCVAVGVAFGEQHSDADDHHCRPE